MSKMEVLQEAKRMSEWMSDRGRFAEAVGILKAAYVIENNSKEIARKELKQMMEDLQKIDHNVGNDLMNYNKLKGVDYVYWLYFM